MATRNQPSLEAQVANAMTLVRAQIHWKPGKDIEHLERRIFYKHLAPATPLNVYEAIIEQVLHDPSSRVYIFHWESDIYPTVVSTYHNQLWLAMFSLSGVMETAFPPRDPDTYFVNARFQYLGTVQELGL